MSLPITKGLKAGEYVLIYQAEFTELNPERKLIISAYCKEKLNLERVSIEDYSVDNFIALDYALYEAVMAQ
jgi:hypothetical protein